MDLCVEGAARARSPTIKNYVGCNCWPTLIVRLQVPGLVLMILVSATHGVLGDPAIERSKLITLWDLVYQHRVEAWQCWWGPAGSWAWSGTGCMDPSVKVVVRMLSPMKNAMVTLVEGIQLHSDKYLDESRWQSWMPHLAWLGVLGQKQLDFTVTPANADRSEGFPSGFFPFFQFSFFFHLFHFFWIIFTFFFNFFSFFSFFSFCWESNSSLT